MGVKEEKAKEKKQTLSKKEEGTTKKKLTAMETQTDDISRISHAAKIVERMVNQNTFDDVSQGQHVFSFPRAVHFCPQTMDW